MEAISRRHSTAPPVPASSPVIAHLSLLHIAILAIVQGITEFLPISSSAHLILTWQAFDAIGLVGIEQSEHDRLVLDIAVHVGTLAAICLYARREVGQMIGGVAQLAVGRWTPGARLAALLVVGTLPLIVAGGRAPGGEK